MKKYGLMLCVPALFFLLSCSQSSNGGAADSLINGRNVNLKGLSLSSGNLCPLFNAERTGYNLEVAHSVDMFDITPFAADTGSVITLNGKEIDSGSKTKVTLDTAQTIVRISVAAKDDAAAKKEYVIAVDRLGM